MRFAKTGKGRFWGHLEMVNIFIRALRRARIPLKFSAGFHPKPKIVFGDALPIGMESLVETAVLTVAEELSPPELVRRLNAELPEGLSVTDCRVYDKTERSPEETLVYRITLDNSDRIDPLAIQRFKSADAFCYEKTNRKGQLKKIDLKAMVHRMECIRPDVMEMEIFHRPEGLLRPDVVLQQVFDLSLEAIRQARVVKLRHGRPGLDFPS